MKKNILIYLLGVSVFFNIIFVKTHTKLSEQQPASQSQTTNQDWNTFIKALAWVESEWNPEAIGQTEDVGYLQITPIIILDANRIVGSNKYSLDDRKDINKSIEIFNVIMDNYNPTHDLNYSLKIWNPKAPVSYHRKVMTKYNELITSNI